jgi:methylase of polypeptide subunit release factors
MTLALFPVDWRELWAGHVTPESTGAYFTRPEIVDLILDLVDYRVGNGRLAALRVAEPSCGDGAFVRRVVDRLARSEKRQRRSRGWEDSLLDHAVTAADINPESVAAARADVVLQLTAAGCPQRRARALAKKWIVEADFLLEPWRGPFDLVVGNPPYVRIESLPNAVLSQYRQQYASMGDRADVYVAFIERGLQLLSPNGQLSYIVANRWAKNMYGRSLRALISRHYHVRAYLDLAHTQPFEQEVSAYPCIIVLDRDTGAPTGAGTLEDIREDTLDSVRRALAPAAVRRSRNGAKQKSTPERRAVRDVVREFEMWYEHGAPWVTTRVDQHAQMALMDRNLPTLQDSAPGTKVGIGVATGADKVFIHEGRPDGIEPDRLLPLAMPGDVHNAGISWSGHWLINPFASSDDGSLVDLREFPGLGRFFGQHESTLRRRYVARNRPPSWFRTIDRIWPALCSKPKLLMRDHAG